MSVVEEKVKRALLKWQEIHPHVRLCFLFGAIKGILAPLDFKPPVLKAFSHHLSCEKALSHGRKGR